ncbi:MAG: MATE family efflux transporter [Oscillospiraceae bacterium]|nr:MATE family efflux transporter [Oscillospiraceae bacterium]
MARQGARLDSSRMGEMHEGRLLLTMAVPMMLSMLVQALYNVVDSIYVAQVSEDCLSALSLAFPAQNILIGLGTGTGVGISTLISRALGSGDPKRAGKVAGNGLFLSFCCWALMAVFGIFFTDAFVSSQTDSAAIRGYADSYLSIVTTASLFIYLEFAAERFLQSTGRTRYSMWTQMIGAVVNIVLDPIFILNPGDKLFGLITMPFGFGMATAGAATATVIGQACAAAAGFWFHARKNQELRFSLRDVKPDWFLIRSVYRIGFPSILMMGVSSVTNYSLNMILMGFQSTAVAVLGAYFKLQSFFFMPVFGLNNGMIPIVGYNFGARKRDRIMRTYRWGVLYACVLMVTGFAVFQLVPGLLLGMFNASEQMLAIGVPALRIISISFLFAGFCIVTVSLCQALGRSLSAFFISVLRQLVALIPAALLLARTGNVVNVFWSFPIAELVAAVCCVIFLRAAIRYLDRQLAAPQES